MTDALVNVLFDKSIISGIEGIVSVFSDKPQIEYLVCQLESLIEEEYFNCFREVLLLEEWDKNLIFECLRKADRLQILLARITEVTGDETGAELWRAFSYNVSAYIQVYYATDEELRLSEENTEDENKTDS